jgi:hypothetical protein
MSLFFKLFNLICLLKSVYNQSITLRSFPTEIIVNENIIGMQGYTNIHKLSNDYIILVWYDVSPAKVMMQMFTPVGNKVDSNITICSNCKGWKSLLVDLANGKFATCYYDLSTSMKIKIYDYNFNVILGPFNASSLTTFISMLSIAKLDDGNIVLAWMFSNYKLSYSIITQAGVILAESSVNSPNLLIGLELESFANNNFILCWREFTTTEYFYCKIFNSLGTPLQQIIVHSYSPIVTNLAYYAMDIQRSKNDNVAVIFVKIIGGIMQTFIWVCNSSGVAIYGPTRVNGQYGTQTWYPSITSLSNGHFMVAYGTNSCCSSIVYAQEFDDNFSETGGRIKISSKDTLVNYLPDIVGLSRTGYAVQFDTISSGNEDIAFQIYYGDDNIFTCKDMNIYIKTSYLYSLANDLKNNISYSYMTDMKVNFIDSPKSGSFQLQDGTNINTNTPTLILSVNFKSPDVQDNFTVSYVAMNHFNVFSSICKLNIGICYPSCDACTSVGDDTNHSCTTCKSGYLSLGSNCYTSCPVSLNGIYYYTTADSCQQCASPCNACTDATACTTCVTGYYLLENSTTNNCVSTCPSGYYLLGNLCRQCNSLCSICMDNPDNCFKCTSSAYYLSPNKCLSECSPGYIPNESRECITCKSLNKYFYIDQCVDSCPKGIEDSVNKLCNDSEIIINSKYNN